MYPSMHPSMWENGDGTGGNANVSIIHMKWGPYRKRTRNFQCPAVNKILDLILRFIGWDAVILQGNVQVTGSQRSGDKATPSAYQVFQYHSSTSNQINIWFHWFPCYLQLIQSYNCSCNKVAMKNSKLKAHWMSKASIFEHFLPYIDISLYSQHILCNVILQLVSIWEIVEVFITNIITKRMYVQASTNALLHLFAQRQQGQ